MDWTQSAAQNWAISALFLCGQLPETAIRAGDGAGQCRRLIGQHWWDSAATKIQSDERNMGHG